MDKSNEITEWYEEYKKVEKWQEALEEPRDDMYEKIAKVIAEYIAKIVKLYKEHISKEASPGQEVVFIKSVLEELASLFDDSTFVGFVYDKYLELKKR